MGSAAAARHAGNAGFTYLGLMFLVALVALMASAAAGTWSFVGRRDKEAQLLFVGAEFRSAITLYVHAHARDAEAFPTTLEQLLGDPQSLTPRRYLRQVYPDPMTGAADWGLVRNDADGITGVYSLSEAKPIRTAVPAGSQERIDFAHARTYRDWKFSVAVRELSARYRHAPPGWNFEKDGEPPPTWDDAPPAPVVETGEPG